MIFAEPSEEAGRRPGSARPHVPVAPAPPKRPPPPALPPASDPAGDIPTRATDADAFPLDETFPGRAFEEEGRDWGRLPIATIFPTHRPSHCSRPIRRRPARYNARCQRT